MPCTYYDAGEIAAMNREELEKLRNELNKATRLLCKVMKENVGSRNFSYDLELDGWYSDHQAKDKARMAAEAAAKAIEDAKIKQQEDLERKQFEILKKKYGDK
jgi:3-oxoacyl-[acyl-carrier-protein] synthase III